MLESALSSSNESTIVYPSHSSGSCEDLDRYHFKRPPSSMRQGPRPLFKSASVPRDQQRDGTLSITDLILVGAQRRPVHRIPFTVEELGVEQVKTTPLDLSVGVKK